MLMSSLTQRLANPTRFMALSARLLPWLAAAKHKVEDLLHPIQRISAEVVRSLWGGKPEPSQRGKGRESREEP